MGGGSGVTLLPYVGQTLGESLIRYMVRERPFSK